jgi:hypothetical protein
MYDTDFPIILNRVIYSGRRLPLIDDGHDNPDSTPMDFTGYTVTGHVRVAVDETSTKLADIDFSGSDLPNGVINGKISAADATVIVAGATAIEGSTYVAYFDVKVTDSLGEPEQWYAGKLRTSKVITP